MRLLFSALLALVTAAAAVPAGQSSDLERLMERVLARRDENWKKLQQYVLDEPARMAVISFRGAISLATSGLPPSMPRRV